MKTGRPTVYTEELLLKAKEYVETAWEENGNMIPSIAGLALHIGVRRETCHVWCHDDDKKEFSNIIDKLLAKQENILLNNGLSGKFVSQITKLVLSKHGYSETQSIDHTTAGQPLTRQPHELTDEELAYIATHGDKGE